MITPDGERLLSGRDMANILGIEYMRLFRAVNSGLIPHIIRGGKRAMYFKEDDTETVTMLRKAAKFSKDYGIGFEKAVRMVQSGAVSLESSETAAV